MVGARGAWIAPAISLRRVAILRIVLYLFVLFDLTKIANDPVPHGYVPSALYRPILLRSWLHLPAPNPAYVHVLQLVLIVSALVAATGRLPRLAGWTCALAMLDWLSNDYSYSKIDHDQFAFVVALAVLPTVGRARLSDRETSEAAGWASAASSSLWSPVTSWPSSPRCASVAGTGPAAPSSPGPSRDAGPGSRISWSRSRIWSWRPSGSCCALRRVRR